MDKRLWFILLAVLVGSIQAIIGRIAYQTSNINPYSYSMNVLLVSLIIFALVVFIRKESLKNISPAIWKKLFFLGVMATAIGMGLYYIGLNYTTAINSAFLMRLQTPFTILFAFFMIKERLNKQQIAALLLMFIGAYFIIFKLNIINLNIGDLIIVGAAAVTGFTNSYFKKEVSENLSITKTMFIRSIFGVPILGAVVFLFTGKEAFQAIATVPVLVIVQALSYSIYMCGLYYGIREIGAGPTTILFLLSPLLTTIFAYVALGESFAIAQAIGACLILLGSYLIIKKPKIKSILDPNKG